MTKIFETPLARIGWRKHCCRCVSNAYRMPPSCRGLLRLVALVFVLVGDITIARAEESLHDKIFASEQWLEFRDGVMANHVRPVTDGQLQSPCRQGISAIDHESFDAAVTACMQAALKGLDRNSSYLTREDRERMNAPPGGGFVGIGLEVRQAPSRNGDIEIVSTIRGSAAERAGLLPGDLIFSIANWPTRGVPMEDAVRSMRGIAGTILELRVHRQGSEVPLRFSVRREQVQLRSVRGGLVAPGVMWLRLSQLRDETRGKIVAEVARLGRQTPDPLARVVLDLRGCPGGLVEALVGIAALWVPEGTAILRTVEQSGPPGRLYRATPADYLKSNPSSNDEPSNGTLRRLPLTILVNQRTAGGAEALAQILRETRQAQVFGQATFGSAAIDKILPLKSGAAFRIEIGRMESPAGSAWESRGVVPDIVVPVQTMAGEYGALPGDTELATLLDTLAAAK